MIITKTMFMVLSSWQSHCESSPGSFDECRMAPSSHRPKTKPDDLGCESTCTGCQKLHPPSPFIIITQPESWYSFYHPTEGRRLSRPSWLVTYRDGLPVHRWSPILVLTGSDVAQLRWSRPTRYQRVVTLSRPCHPSVYNGHQKCEHDSLLQIDTSGSQGKGMKRLTFGVRRSKVKVTWS